MNNMDSDKANELFNKTLTSALDTHAPEQNYKNIPHKYVTAELDVPCSSEIIKNQRSLIQEVHGKVKRKQSIHKLSQQFKIT